MMMKQSLFVAAAALAAITTTTTTNAFSVSTSSGSTVTTTTRSNTALHLLPEQGKQLEAAFHAAYAKAALDNEDKHVENQSRAATATAPKPDAEASSSKLSASARAFVSRVFALPSNIIRGHPFPNLEGLPSSHRHAYRQEEPSDQDDVVLFPVVGFQFVKDAPHHVGVLATTRTSNAACRLPTGQKEELVGWYSKACHLDLESEDYAAQPTAAATRQDKEAKES